MSGKPDQFDALRTIVETLKDFDQKETEQVLRWANEKLGITLATQPSPASGAQQSAGQPVIPVGGTDIRSFIAAKQPKSDNQFAAAVAYYYQFEAPVADRKAEISKDDLLEAARLANRARPNAPAQTLVNAHNQGWLDNGSSRGLYRLNSVGENLVAMVLPGDGVNQISKPRKKKSNAKRKAAQKKAKPKKKNGK